MFVHENLSDAGDFFFPQGGVILWDTHVTADLFKTNNRGIKIWVRGEMTS